MALQRRRNQIAQAKCVIESIQAENGVITDEHRERAKHDPLVAGLLKSHQKLKTIAGQATIRLSEDLYKLPTHFVLECIQNADDNHYAPGVEPVLSITVRSDRIQLDCNENGFKDADVRAICSIGQSTKTGGGGYIGEKGIGFKSVFKVAQQVHIHSPPYSFQFDKTRELGMITPLWVDDEAIQITLRKDFQTAILLLPTAGETYMRHFADFKVIKPTLLLFLRRLKRLELSIHEDSSSARQATTRKILTCEKSVDGQFASLTVNDSLSAHSQQYSYRIYRHKIFVQDRRRNGNDVTEIAVAFPVDSLGAMEESRQLIHAFLPVGDFGFKVLIQADFLVTTSREDVDRSKSWNLTLRKEIPAVFLTGIVEFIQANSEDPLRYTWMRYIPRDITDSFWEPVQQSILQLIREKPVLESRAGSLCLPDQLEFLSSRAMNRDGEPLFGRLSEYLSTKYLPQDHEILRIIGVKPYSPQVVFRRLHSMPDRAIKSKPRSWHEDLAKFVQHVHGDNEVQIWNECLVLIKPKSLIPLQSGAWVSALDLQRSPVFFSEGVDGSKIPSDINLRLVESDSPITPVQKAFFHLLGVKDCDQSEVARLILQKHADSSPPPRAAAISHAEYIYNLPGDTREGLDVHDLWLYDEQEVPAKGHELYVHGKKSKYSISVLFQDSGLQLRFLSSDYGKTAISGARGRQFLKWLIAQSGLSDCPKIEKSGTLSHEFTFILKHRPDEVLHILKHYWHQYERKVNQSIRELIADHQVQCFGEPQPVRKPLKETYIPDPELKKLASELCPKVDFLPFLHIQPFNSSDWKFLAAFRVGMIADLDFYFWLGRQERFRENCTIGTAKKLLKTIARLTGQNTEQVKRTFELLGVPVADCKTWVNPRQCVWDAPVGFEPKHNLKSIYGDDFEISSLVRSTLNIDDAGILDVIRDLVASATSDAYLLAAGEYIAAKLRDLTDETVITTVRHNFWRHPLIVVPIPNASKRATKSSCVWGGPTLSHKFNLKTFYENNAAMRSLICNHLCIKGPLLEDLLQELVNLKNNPEATGADVAPIYAHMFQAVEGPSKQYYKDTIIRSFHSQSLVYTRDGTGKNCWRKPSDCVWKAGFPIRCKVPIADIHNLDSNVATGFLRNTVGIEDAGLMEYVEDLRLLHKEGRRKRRDVESLYKHIENNVGRRRDELKKIFDSEPLIWADQSEVPQWVTLQNCVWEAPSCLRSKTSLFRCYPAHKDLFTITLGLQNATTLTIAHELRAAGEEFNRELQNTSAPSVPSKRRIIDLLKAITAIRPWILSSEAIEILRSAIIWPYRRRKDRQTHLVRLDHGFLVPDHQHFLNLFEDDLPILDLTVREVRELRPLLLKLHLNDRFLSKSVQCKDSATDKTLEDTKLSKDLQDRASALCYCWEHFTDEEKRPTEKEKIFALLKNVTIYRAMDIFTVYEINSQGIYRKASEEGLLRMAVDGNRLEIFVPRDDDGQKHAFATCLSKEMIKFLKIDENKSWPTVNALLTVGIRQLEKTLDRQGILHHGTEGRVRPDVGGHLSKQATSSETTQDDAMLSGKRPNSESDVQEIFGMPSLIQVQDAIDSFAQKRESVIRKARDADVTVNNHADEITSRPSSSLPLSVEVSTHSSPRFLRSTAHQQNSSPPRATSASPSGRRLSRLNPSPSAATRAHGSSQSSSEPIPNNQPTVPNFASSINSSRPSIVRSGVERARDTGIGFLGEQYIVEILKQHLPDFKELTHWTSTLRAFAGLAPYTEGEKTDLTYPDTAGHLSKLLAAWVTGKIPKWLVTASTSDPMPRPTYWLEVKTTSGGYENAFFISVAQFDLMRSMALRTDEMPKDVYVLLRVSEIEGDVKVRAYLDPWSRIYEDKMRLAAQHIAITPRE